MPEIPNPKSPKSLRETLHVLIKGSGSPVQVSRLRV